VTENDSVYALNASTGTVEWRTHLATPVTGSTLPCGNIEPVTGITGTPVIDPSSDSLFAVAFVSPGTHELFDLSLSSGSVRHVVPIDPPGATATLEQQRGALALLGGVVYVPFGGLAGDCGAYHGWVVGVREDGTGGLLSYEVPTGRAGGIWAPGGISIGANGDLYVATGNSDATATFDFGDADIELSPALTEVEYFAPSNWADLNSHDTDLGSLAPTVLPNGDLFQVGKQGVGYLLSGANLGGINGQLFEGNVCSGAYGGTARVGWTVVVPCTDGLVEVATNATSFSIAWTASGFDAGPPIVTASVVWSIDIGSGSLLGFNLTTGHEIASFHLGAVVHFVTPAAGPGTLYAVAGERVFAVSFA
jgi:outer membrane protein assembly factor BamB